MTAYKAGHVQFDFTDSHDPAAVIQPASIDYHLNRGGVEYRQLSVLRTVTLLGRLVDEQGRGLAGVSVINHASRSVSEADGYFTVQMSQSAPSLDIRRAGQPLCSLTLDLAALRHEDEIVLTGDLPCTPAPLAHAWQPDAGRDS